MLKLLLVAVLMAASQGDSLAQGQPALPANSGLPTRQLTAGIHVINAELAIDPRHRAVGLMNRLHLPQSQGMLFVFERQALHCFWMRNTLIPLSIAFLADDGTVVNIEDMAPKTEDSHCPARDIRYALEMNQGWFARRGIKTGSRIVGLP